MTTPRLFIPEMAGGEDGSTSPRTWSTGSTVVLPATASHHARRVLRLRPDDAIVVFDGRGNEYAAVLVNEPGDETANASRCVARILGGGAVDREASIAITLVQALSAQEKIDWLVEKCVELGVRQLLLAPAERSVVRLDDARQERRLGRWREIAAAACCQCGRNRLLEIALAGTLAAALQLARDASASQWILDPAASSGLAVGPDGVSPATPGGRPGLACAVGPEGGFTSAELGQAESLGYVRARLGPRVLRTETGLAAVTALLALHGEYTR